MSIINWDFFMGYLVGTLVYWLLRRDHVKTIKAQRQEIARLQWRLLDKPLILLICLLGLTGCKPSVKRTLEDSESTYYERCMGTATVGACRYIIFESAYGAGMVHAGDCPNPAHVANSLEVE